MQNAGPRRPWDWPLWRRYANKRVPASTHYCGLAVDFPTDTGATTPMDPYVVVYEGNSRFKTYANRAVARRAASRGYPDQSAVAQTLGIPHAAVRQIERQFGKGTVMRMGDDGARQKIAAVSTGVLSLDLALGIGGVPRGRIVEIYGPESSGKTTLVYEIIAQAQKAGGTCTMPPRR